MFLGRKNFLNDKQREELKTFVLQKTPHTDKDKDNKPCEVICSLNDKGWVSKIYKEHQGSLRRRHNPTEK